MRTQDLPLDPTAKTLYNNTLDMLSDFPHVVVNLRMLAEKPSSLVKYLRLLLLETRDGMRRGFPPTIVHQLLGLHNHLAPDQPLVHRDFNE